MKTLMTAGAALLMTTSIAAAGGLDRSGQGIGVIFEDGDYVELSFGSVSPEVSSSSLANANIANSYTSFGLGIRQQMNPNFAMALIIDQPFGASVTYPAAGGGSTATVNSLAVTGLGQYQFNENVSVHAGVRVLNMSGDLLDASRAFPGNQATTINSGTDVGYVVGGAYERPDIALRVALTYSSAITVDTTSDIPSLGATDIPTSAAMPQSVNLDFQSGVAADTLVFGSIRWVNWSETTVNIGTSEVLSYDNDTFTYSIGVGRKFSDQFSGAVSIGYEEALGGLANNFAPTDGNISLSVGGTYTMDTGMEITAGVRYIDLGDATATSGLPFQDNSAVAVGLKIGYSF